MKVYFVGNFTDIDIMVNAKINNILFSFANFKGRNINKKIEVLKRLSKTKGIIIDSGIYTHLYGTAAEKLSGIFTKKYINDYIFQYLKFINKLIRHDNIKFIEYDCQEIVGGNRIWDIRESFMRRIPKEKHKNIIHVYHADQDKNIQGLLDYSKYIAIPTRDIKQENNSKVFKKDFLKIILRIRAVKKKLHILGCTDVFLLKKIIKDVESCDSATWIIRFARIGSKNIKTIKRCIAGNMRYSDMEIIFKNFIKKHGIDVSKYSEIRKQLLIMAIAFSFYYRKEFGINYR